MGYIRDLQSNPDIQAFPGATYEIDGDVPAAQCQEQRPQGPFYSISIGSPNVVQAGMFAEYDLTGKKIDILSTVSNNGTYNVLSNTDDYVVTDHIFTENDATVSIIVYDTGEVYITRNEASFLRFIQVQGATYTIKGGKIFTNLANPPMEDACTIAFNPI